MKTLFLILALLALPLVSLPIHAQERDAKIDRLTDQISELAKQQSKLSDKVDKLVDKVDKLVEQQAITSTKLDTFEKSVDKRFDMLFYLMLGMLAGIFALIGMIFWDRRAANAPIKIKVITLQKEVKELKEKEIKHLEKETKMELYIKQISQIDNRFAPFNP